MQQTRKSRQRDAILNNLRARCDHPTAMELYLSVREEIPSLSLGTLYRNLKGLCDSGQIIRLSDGGEEHYDACTAPHWYIKCDCCGRFYDLPVSPEAVLAVPIPEYDGEIRDYSLIFFGVCAHCACAAGEK